MKGSWGLNLCGAKWNCLVCARYHDNLEMLTAIRNQYITGLPADVVLYIVDPPCDIPPKELNAHANRQMWYKKRVALAEPAVNAGFAFVQVMRRLKKAEDVISEQTGDKMIAHIMELAGVSKKVQVQQQVSVTWETTVNKAATETDADAVFTLSDEDFVDVTEPFEERDAPTD